MEDIISKDLLCDVQFDNKTAYDINQSFVHEKENKEKLLDCNEKKVNLRKQD